MVRFNGKQITVNACLKKLGVQKNKRIIRKFLNNYPDINFDQIYSQYYPHRFDIEISQPWQLAMLSGEPSCIYDQLSENILKQRDNNGANIIHYAGLSGSILGAASLLEQLTNLKTIPSDRLTQVLSRQKDSFGADVGHYAAQSGNTEFFFEFMRSHEELANKVDDDGTSHAHYAAMSGNADHLFAVLKKYPNLEKSRDKLNANIAHYAAVSGNPECLFKVLEKYPKLKDSQDNEGANIAHYAALSGNPHCVLSVLQKYPHFKNSVDLDGDTLADYAAWSEKRRCLKQLLLAYPDLLRTAETSESETSIPIKEVVKEVRDELEKRALAEQSLDADRVVPTPPQPVLIEEKISNPLPLRRRHIVLDRTAIDKAADDLPLEHPSKHKIGFFARKFQQWRGHRQHTDDHIPLLKPKRD